jgi:hypothetical protein
MSNSLDGKSKLSDKSANKKVAIISVLFIDLTRRSELDLAKKYPEIFKFKGSC